MFDPFSASLGVFYRGPGSVEAQYQPRGAAAPLPGSIRVIRGQPDSEANLAETRTIEGTNVFEIQRADVAEPRHGDTLIIAGTSFRLLGDAMLDLEGLSWKIGGSEI
ncbi:hypothetical protein [Sphingomonas sp. BK235]|uniref:head-tail joining protein n=1 Tax=Sphingomonas sp. BK235 TaxID=2512131 RepID=UPI00104C3BB5|nr:hypothetical protein [Sphingomonas sp. BK235]TCP30697.1 hypothetical protein EV292_11254 [Sphingomonas sp. BK235]